MRGKEYCFNKQLKFSRITPAYAGKSRAFRLQFALLQDHPRLCGEKGILRRTRKSRIGSPPPMRGKGRLKNLPIPQIRITPAYAGKSRKLSACRRKR